MEERLTEYVEKKDCYKLVAKSYYGGPDFDSAIQKIGQYEDIEEELGIDLIVVIKAIKNGIYLKHDNKIEYRGWFHLDVVSATSCWFIANSLISLNLKDYGKTWALTKEELK